MLANIKTEHPDILLAYGSRAVGGCGNGGGNDQVRIKVLFSKMCVLAITNLPLLSSQMRFSAHGQQTNSRDLIKQKMFNVPQQFLRLKKKQPATASFL